MIVSRLSGRHGRHGDPHLSLRHGEQRALVDRLAGPSRICPSLLLGVDLDICWGFY